MDGATSMHSNLNVAMTGVQNLNPNNDNFQLFDSSGIATIWPFDGAQREEENRQLGGGLNSVLYSSELPTFRNGSTNTDNIDPEYTTKGSSSKKVKMNRQDHQSSRTDDLASHLYGGTGRYDSTEGEDLFTITVDDLEKAIEVLSSNHWQILDKLHPEHEVAKAYQMVKLAVTMLTDTEQYQIINLLISQQYRPTDIIPGTVGAFLFGCSQETYGDINRVCSPLCVTGIYPKGEFAPQCEHQVWIQHNQSGVIRFGRLRSSSDAHKAFIYVTDNFTGFTNDEIEHFNKSNVVTAQVLTTKKSKHWTLIKMAPLNEMPIEGVMRPISGNLFGLDSEELQPFRSEGTETLYGSISSGAVIIVITIIVLVLGLLALAWVWFGSRR